MKPKKRTAVKVKPSMKWQIGEYDRSMEFKTHLPYPLLLLCKIVNVTPRQLILDFLDNLSCSSWKRKGREEVKEKLIEYFILHKYGAEYYSTDEIREIFKELDAVGMLFPYGNSKMIDVYAKWREKHHKYFFKKWFYKNQRKPSCV